MIRNKFISGPYDAYLGLQPGMTYDEAFSHLLSRIERLERKSNEQEIERINKELPKKYIQDGKVAVLISHGYGEGWSTYQQQGTEEFWCMDRRLVELYIDIVNKDDVEKYIREELKLTDPSYYIGMGGWEDIRIQWVDEGTRFTIEEHDGFESLLFIKDIEIIA